MERMFEEDDDLYVEDLHENDDSDDTYSDFVVDEVNENEADDAEDDYAGTNSISKTFAAVQRHYEPLIFGPERLFESSKLQFKTRTVPNSRQQGEVIVETIRFATRKLYADGQIEYILFKCPSPHKPAMVLAEAVDRALNAFARLSNGYLHLPMSLALMEDKSARDILHSGIETAKFFFRTLSNFAASFLNRILKGETLTLSVPEKAEIKAHNSKLGTAGGTYLVLTTNKNNQVAGVYVGRTNSLQRRMKDHQINLAIATHTSDSFAHIESHFYQSAARELHYGGELYFIPANIFSITSQGEFSSDFSQSQPNFHLHDFFLTIAIDAHDHVAVFEALLSCITGSFQLKEAFLEFRAGFGMPLVSFIGYNSTPCMERPERFNQYAENVANPTLSPMILELRNLYLRAAHAARLDDQKKEIEQDYRHKHAAYMMESANVSNDSELPLFVSLQLLVGDPDSASDVFLGTSPKYGEIYGGLKLYLKDLDLVFGSSCPLWDGTGFPEEVSSPLRGVGLSLYSFSSNTWIPISANFRFRYVVSRFTAFASQAAIVARQSITYHSDRNAPNHSSEPESDEEEDVPAFQIFQRTLPSTGYSPRIGVRGQRTHTILIPRRMLRMWFPDGTYPQGLPLSVKIEATRARSPDEVKIFLRLDSIGQSDNEGVWFNALRYAKDGMPSAAIWRYIQETQRGTRNLDEESQVNKML
ncbi:hypothetical protein L7F22_067910 [Adiantum nelumboides]|nr:hypothetical protein [Adiantum nelumboides]